MRRAFRICGCFVVFSMLLACFGITTYADTSFSDVKPGSYYEGAVQWAVENNITGGTSETTFSPKKVCTRAQIVTFLWKAAGSPQPGNMECSFTDVPEGSYFYLPVLWAVEVGVTGGTSDTTFSPKAPCTRAQIVTFLWKYMGAPETGAEMSSLSDVKTTYYTQAVYWAVLNGITSGTSKTLFSPKKTCTRAEAMVFLYKVSAVNEATCTAAKTTCYGCMICDEAFSKTEGSPLGHDFTVADSSPPTCTEAGTTKYRCQRGGCQETYAETSPPMGHNYEIVESVKATPTSDGYNVLQCTRCADSYTVVKPYECDHRWKKTAQVESTCSQPGYVEYTCIYCNTKRRDEAPLKDHSFMCKVTKPPTPSDPVARETFTCVVCGYEETKDVQVSPHNTMTSEEAQLITLLNQARAAYGAPPLEVKMQFFEFSMWRTYELVARFSHTRPNGSSWYTVLDSLGLEYPYGLGENIQYMARDNWTVQEIHEAYMNSDGHRENLLKTQWNACTVYILRFPGYTFCCEHFYITD